MDVTYWRALIVGTKRAAIYRPVCRGCLDVDPVSLVVESCDVCDRPTAYATAPPEGKGTWIGWVTVCSIDCLNVARAEREPPPPDPRRCIWCGGEFQPARRSNARLCSAACRQRKHRARPVADDVAEIRAVFDELGLPWPDDGKLPPLMGDAIADAINRLGADVNTERGPTRDVNP